MLHSGRAELTNLSGVPPPQGYDLLLHERSAGMAKQIVMNASGDTRYEFDAADAAGVAEAESRFKQLTGAGFTAAVRRGDGRPELLRSFDPSAEETVFFPRLQGG
jgi:hypothetical protein